MPTAALVTQRLSHCAAAAPRAPRLGARPARHTIHCHAAAKELTMLIPDYNMPTCNDKPCLGVPALITGFATVAAAVVLQSLAKKGRAATQCIKAELGNDAVFPLPIPEADPRAYQLALAQSRQCMCVSKSVMHMKAGDPARAMVELGRALQENSVCRTPVLDGRYSREAMLDLYRLHLKNGPVPPNFATLLQLRELLNLTRADCDLVEEEVMTAGEAFSI